MKELTEEIIQDLGCELDEKMQIGNSPLFDCKFYKLQEGLYLTNYDWIINKPVKDGLWMILCRNFRMLVSEEALIDQSGRIIIKQEIKRAIDKYGIPTTINDTHK